jgi:hypothetical protein
MGDLRVFENRHAQLLGLLEEMARELGIELEGEICRFVVTPSEIRIETEVLADDGTWERSNIYTRRFN